MKIELNKAKKIELLKAIKLGELDTAIIDNWRTDNQRAPRILTPKEARELWAQLDKEY